ncbi:hypothetical protein TNCV_4333681 [Trichonephila clavipes]|nr:hypothetical protein TNCV_4333681 [Trichonephila clavipes]
MGAAALSKYKNCPGFLELLKKLLLLDFRQGMTSEISSLQIWYHQLTGCILCDSDQSTTAEHLNVYPALISLNSTVEKYWRACALMA